MWSPLVYCNVWAYCCLLLGSGTHLYRITFVFYFEQQQSLVNQQTLKDNLQLMRLVSQYIECFYPVAMYRLIVYSRYLMCIFEFIVSVWQDWLHAGSNMSFQTLWSRLMLFDWCFFTNVYLIKWAVVYNKYIFYIFCLFDSLSFLTTLSAILYALHRLLTPAWHAPCIGKTYE